jgi:hypothetical protein
MQQMESRYAQLEKLLKQATDTLQQVNEKNKVNNQK